MKNKIIRIVRWKYFFYLLAVFFALFALSSFGKPLYSVFPPAIYLDSPSNMCEELNNDQAVQSQQIKAIIDNKGGRLLIINSENIFVSQIFFDSGNSHLNLAESVYVYDNEIFVSGYLMDENESSYTQSCICRYDSKGNYKGTLWCRPISSNNYFRQVLNVYKSECDIFVVSYEYQYLFLDKIKYNDTLINNDTCCECQTINQTYYNEEWMQALYDRQTNTTILFDVMLNSYKYDSNGLVQFDVNTFFNEICLKNNYLYTLQLNKNDKDDSFLQIKSTISDEIINLNLSYLTVRIDFQNSKLYISNFEDNTVSTIDFIKHEHATNSCFYYSFIFTIYTFFVWLSYAYLLIMFICFIIRWLYIRKKDISKMHMLIISVISGLIIVLSVTVFTNVQFYFVSKDMVLSKVDALTQYISDSMSYNSAELNKSSLNKNIVGEKIATENDLILEDFCSKMTTLTDNFNDKNQNLQYILYGFDDEHQQLQYITGSQNLVSVGYIDSAINQDDINNIMNNINVSGQEDNSRYTYIYSIMPIKNLDNKIIGAIELYSSLNSLISTHLIILKDCLMIIILFSIFLYMFIYEILIFRNSIKNYISSKYKNIAHNEIHFVSTMEFLKNFCLSVDSVLGVLITKDMLLASGNDSNGILIGLPAVLLGIGSIFGSSLHPILNRVLSIKKIYLLSSIIMGLSMLFTSYSVYINNYVFYTASKIFFGIGFGLLYVSNFTISMCVDDESTRFTALRNSSLTDVSAPILAVLICGNVANIFGNFSIYILGIFVAVFIFALSIFIMPNKAHFSTLNNIKSNISLKATIQFFNSPAIISCVLVCLLSFCIGAYKSYIFPLYTNDMNVSNIDISNYFTIASALVVVFSAGIDKVFKRFDHWNNVIYILLMLFIIFIMFIFNQTLIWLIVAFFLSTLIQKSLITEWKMLWPRRCKALKIDPASIQPYFSVIDSISYAIRPLILGSFLFFGGNGACIALGISCLVVLLFFFVFTKNTEIRNKT